MGMEGRDDAGRFAAGNPGGPGRPRRTIEREYLAVLGSAVSLDDWREVVARAVADAQAGDAAARNWLAKYLLGERPGSLLDLAAADAAGEGIEDAVAQRIVEQQRTREWESQIGKLLGDADCQ